MTVRVLKLPVVLTRACISRSLLYDKMSRGEFPRPVRLGARAVAWREDDIEAWLMARPSTDAE